MKFLHFSFLPRSADAALLLLRLWFGLSMALLHGWGKLTGFSEMSQKFGDPLGIGLSGSVSLGLAMFGELVCGILIAIGAFTRFAAIGLIITMFVAFWIAHGHKLTGPGNGEMAFLYLGAATAIFIAGAGKYSVDAKLGVK